MVQQKAGNHLHVVERGLGMQLLTSPSSSPVIIIIITSSVHYQFKGDLSPRWMRLGHKKGLYSDHESKEAMGICRSLKYQFGRDSIRNCFLLFLPMQLQFQANKIVNGTGQEVKMVKGRKKGLFCCCCCYCSAGCFGIDWA